MTTEEILLGEVRVMRAEWREDIIRLHQKIDEVHTQTTKTNGRVTELEKKHDSCPGKISLELHNKNNNKDSKEYWLGSNLYNIAAIAVIIVAIVGAIKLFL